MELFDKVLRIMRTNDNRAVNCLVDKIDKFTSAQTFVWSVEQKQTTFKGNLIHHAGCY